jgi:hypothetical protein
MSNVTTIIEPCFGKLYNVCNKASVRGVKTVRVNMESIAILFNKIHDGDTQVIHLLRDPRAVSISRQKQSSFRSKYSKDNLTMEAAFYCKTAFNDVIQRNSLESAFPGRFMELIHDKYVLNPLKTADQVYQFLNLNFTAGLKHWLVKNTVVTKDSHMLSTNWTHLLTYDKVLAINHVCSKLFESLKFKFI